MPLTKKRLDARVRSASVRRRVQAAAAAAAASVVVLVPSLAGAAGGNTADTFKANGLTLFSAANWTAGLPGPMNDAIFDTAYPAAGKNLVAVISNAIVTYGSLDDLNTNGSISIGDNSSKAGQPSVITLGGPQNQGNAVAPDPGDLLYVASGANLSILPTQQASGATSFLSLNLGQTGNIDAVGTLGISSVITSTGGTFGINKTGSGVLTLSGNNLYTGTTTVTAGELRINNTAGSGTDSGTGGGLVNIATGGTLGGTGTIANGTTAANAVVVNGTITAGPDDIKTGRLTTGAQQWVGGGTFAVKVTDSAGTITGNDSLLLNGLTFAPGTGALFTINVTAAAGTAVNNTTQLVLADDTEASTSNPFASKATLAQLQLTVNGVPDTSGTLKLDVAPDVSGSGYDLVLDVATPEPTSLVLACIAAAPVMLRRRRRPV